MKGDAVGIRVETLAATRLSGWGRRFDEVRSAEDQPSVIYLHVPRLPLRSFALHHHHQQEQQQTKHSSLPAHGSSGFPFDIEDMLLKRSCGKEL